MSKEYVEGGVPPAAAIVQPPYATYWVPVSVQSDAETENPVAAMVRSQFAGRVRSVDSKGPLAGSNANIGATLTVGWRRILTMAPTVSVGAGLPEIVASVKSWPQALPSPATPPAELMQAATMSPSV